MSEKSDKALKMIENAKAQGRLNVENPQELMNKLSERYGDKAYDLVVDSLMKPAEVMKGLGQQPTTSAKTLEYLAGNEISANNIEKLGGKINQQLANTNIETVEKTTPIAKPQPQVQQPSPQTDLSQIGKVDVYGNKIQSDEPENYQDDSSYSNNTQNNYNNSSQSNDPWMDLFKSLLEMAMTAAVMARMMRSPFPVHGHLFEDRILHFNHCVDHRSKTEKTLDKVAGVLHGAGEVAYGIGDIVGAIKGGR